MLYSRVIYPSDLELYRTFFNVSMKALAIVLPRTVDGTRAVSANDTYFCLFNHSVRSNPHIKECA